MNQQEKELLLKDLCSRLPYGVKINWIDSNETMGVTFEPISDYEDNLYPLSTLVFTLTNDKSSDPGWKPMLYPTSALTQEITVNGETFVPIVRLFHRMKYADDVCIIDSFKTDDNISEIRFRLDVVGSCTGRFIYHHNQHSFQCYENGKGVLAPYQLEGHDLMNEWHINFRLPDHLFVPVTETFNPYICL